MQSKKYCPLCGDFNIRRIQRNFIEKKILNSSYKYQCQGCYHSFTRNRMDKNKAIFRHDRPVETDSTL